MLLNFCQSRANFFQQRTGQVLLAMAILCLGAFENQAALRCGDELRKNANDFILRQNPQRSVRYTLYLAGDPQASVAEVDCIPVDADDLACPKGADKCQIRFLAHPPF